MKTKKFFLFIAFLIAFIAIIVGLAYFNIHFFREAPEAVRWSFAIGAVVIGSILALMGNTLTPAKKESRWSAAFRFPLGIAAGAVVGYLLRVLQHKSFDFASMIFTFSIILIFVSFYLTVRNKLKVK